MALKEIFPHHTEADLAKCLARFGNNVNITAEQLLAQGFSLTLSKSSLVISSPPRVETSTVTRGHSSSQRVSSENNDCWPCRVSSIPSCSNTNTHKRQALSHNVASSIHKEQIRIQTHHPTNHSWEKNMDEIDSQEQRHFKKTHVEYSTMELDEFISKDNPTWLPLHIHPSHQRKLLLCERYVIGCSTSRKGSTKGQEPITFTVSSKSLETLQHSAAAFIIRFHGNQVQGTLDRSLGIFLAPLIRQSLISLEGQIIMEDLHLNIGKEIPIQLRIYIREDPHVFFQLFHDQQHYPEHIDTQSKENKICLENGTRNDNDNSHGKSFISRAFHSSHYTTNKKRTKQPESYYHYRQQQAGHEPSRGGILRNAAFTLLQWAEYGMMKQDMDGGDKVEEEEEESTHKLNASTWIEFEKKNSMKCNNSRSDDKDTSNLPDTDQDDETVEEDEDDDDDDDDDEEGNLDESNHVTINATVLETNSMFLDISSCNGEGGIENQGNRMYEMDDPEALQQKGTHLLPHQKYALYWMMQREQWCMNHQQQHHLQLDHNQEEKEKQCKQDDHNDMDDEMDSENVEPVKKQMPRKKGAEVNPLDLEILRQLLQPQGKQDSLTIQSASSCFLTTSDISCDFGK